MGKITNAKALNEAIIELEKQKTSQWLILKEDAGIVYENLKPINVIKRTINDLSSSEGLIENIISSLVGISSGFVSRKIVVGKSTSIFRNIFGTILQTAITNLIIRHPEMIKSIGSKIVDRFFGRKDENPV